MPLIFSSTDSLSLSYFLKIFVKKGIAFVIIKVNPIARIGIVQRKINAIFALIINDIVSEKISIKGDTLRWDLLFAFSEIK